MCLIAFAWMPEYERCLVLAANRDEFHQRPAGPLAWWPEPLDCLAGRDLKAGGTWLAVARNGRWAAVTNFRDPGAPTGTASRGDLPLAFLRGDSSPADCVASAYARRADYGPFNFLAGDRNSLWYAGSRARPQAVQPGLHALSNGLLDQAWPKSRRATTALGGLLAGANEIDPDRLFDLLDDREPASDEELPDTGIGLEAERMLSPPFIVSSGYGTRSSTVLSLGTEILAAERRFAGNGQTLGELCYRYARVDL
ncbi:MAG: NRDE family protein [Wenzhouxiangella sp.]|nr:NRDE family protein [Wenzhouxiangella sp.]TVR98484.1 MAG: NRDE family protein [Wenzhouxiangellaceae bacterium]